MPSYTESSSIFGSMNSNRTCRGSALYSSESTIATVTVTSTTMMLFLTSAQKNGLWMAAPKCESVGCSENHVGVRLLIWSSGLNAVDTIQKIGKTMMTKRAMPTVFQSARRDCLRVIPPLRSAPSCARRRRSSPRRSGA